MAESLREKNLRTNITGIKSDITSNVECAVCLQISVHPAELPCGHVFCYLCIKGIVNQGRRCAMCRQDIPVDYLDKPKLLKPVDVENTSKGFEDGHLWFYEGHNGWWQYDERTSLELESAYQRGERCCELLIAGFLYIADFDAMLQYRCNDPRRRRRIKRDLATISAKGVAGLKATADNHSSAPSTPDLVSNVLIPDLQSLHISGQPLQSHVNDISFTSLANVPTSSSDHQVLNLVQNDTRHRTFPLVIPNSICNLTSSTNSNSRSLNERNNTISPRIDSAIFDTLDWTVEQIEALNLELSNDFENVFRDVNRYGQLNSILGVNTSDNLSNNAGSQPATNHLDCALPRRGSTSSRTSCSYRSKSTSSPQTK